MGMKLKSLAVTFTLATGLFMGPGALLAAAAPDIELSEMEHNFGEVVMGGNTTHKFTIKNTGDEVLQLENVKAGCGCTVPTGWDREIAPGESTEVTVEYKNQGRPGPFNKSVTITSNDPDEGRLVYRISGNILTEVEAEPRRIYQQKVYRDEGFTQELTLSTKMMDTLEIHEITATNEHLEFEIKDVDGSQTEKKVMVKLKKDAPLGPMHGTIHVKTNAKQQERVDIRFHTQVVGDVDLSNQRLSFRPFENGDVQEQFITIKDRSESGDFKIERVDDLANNLDVSVETVKEGVEYKLVAKTLPNYNKEGHYAGSVEIVTNKPGEEKVNVHYSIFIRKPVDQASAN